MIVSFGLFFFRALIDGRVNIVSPILLREIKTVVEEFLHSELNNFIM